MCKKKLFSLLFPTTDLKSEMQMHRVGNRGDRGDTTPEPGLEALHFAYSTPQKALWVQAIYLLSHCQVTQVQVTQPSWGAAWCMKMKSLQRPGTHPREIRNRKTTSSSPLGKHQETHSLLQIHPKYFLWMRQQLLLGMSGPSQSREPQGWGMSLCICRYAWIWELPGYINFAYNIKACFRNLVLPPGLLYPINLGYRSKSDIKVAGMIRILSWESTCLFSVATYYTVPPTDRTTALIPCQIMSDHEESLQQG